jgi:F-type H+-transporting ATPase subunit a
MIGNIFASTPPVVSIGPEKLFNIGPFTITNTQVLGIIGVIILLVLAFTVVHKVRHGSRSRFTHGAMWMFETLYDTTVDVVGDRSVALKVLPLSVTLFFFFLVNNWLGIIPLLNAITYHGQSLIRGAAADMNMTFGLAFISIGTAQVWAIKRRGFMGNVRRYLKSPLKDPLGSFEGALEIIAEISRTLALSLRMFGNIFGGEVLLAVIAYLTSWAAPIALPLFYILELFVGAVQAYVFYMLTIAFISLGLPEGGDRGGGHAERPPTKVHAPA